jgi:amino acid permease
MGELRNKEYKSTMSLPPIVSYRTYPYESSWQWLRAAYDLSFCVLLVVFHGWQTLADPILVSDFIASYITVIYFSGGDDKSHAN